MQHGNQGCPRFLEHEHGHWKKLMQKGLDATSGLAHGNYSKNQSTQFTRNKACNWEWLDTRLQNTNKQSKAQTPRNGWGICACSQIYMCFSGLRWNVNVAQYFSFLPQNRSDNLTQCRYGGKIAMEQKPWTHKQQFTKLQPTELMLVAHSCAKLDVGTLELLKMRG